MADPKLNVFSTARQYKQARGAFGKLLAAAEVEQDRRVAAEIAKLKTPADVRRWQRRVRRNLHEILGEFPEKTPLRARTVGRIEMPGCRVENVIFESRPRYFVTANVYLPADLDGPAPAVLVPCGHVAEGKHCRAYRDTGIGFALHGFVAMVYDPTGQGERSECLDRRTGRHWVHREVPQHHHTGKPLVLTGRTLAGWRTWDGIRCLDYLCGRREVDAKRIGVVGCSGGGAMTMLITAVDPRVVACAPSHPGGSMENTHLRGRRPPDRRLYSLIAPRPCRIIMGRDAKRELAGHRRKLEIMRPFYEACGHGDRLEFLLVDGGHNTSKAKREPSYQWLLRWLGDPDADFREPAFRGPAPRRLWCTKTGQVATSLGGETMCSINAGRSRQLAKRRDPATPKLLRKRVAESICFRACDAPLRTRTIRTVAMRRGRVEVLCFESEPGMPIPSLLFLPDAAGVKTPVVLHVSEAGKPTSLNAAFLPLLLAKRGFPVLSIDVRDTGETEWEPAEEDFWPPRKRPQLYDWSARRWGHDLLAIRALGIGRSRSGMRVLDVLRAVDLLNKRKDTRSRRVVAVGEGRGGIYALKAAGLDERIAAVAAVRMLASYRLIAENARYTEFSHFWTPGVLAQYDVPDLTELVVPRPICIVDPIDHRSRRLSQRAAEELFAGSMVRRIQTAGTTAAVARVVADFIERSRFS